MIKVYQEDSGVIVVAKKGDRETLVRELSCIFEFILNNPQNIPNMGFTPKELKNIYKTLVPTIKKSKKK